MQRLSRRKVLAAGTATAVSLAGCLGDGTAEADEWAIDRTFDVEATQYQGPECGCCDVYADYLEDHLETALDIEETDDLRSVKAARGVPEALTSCHTVDFGDYVVEGHIPMEVVEKLLDERPDVRGIALPDMPAGSPGMRGEKDGTWTIYEFDEYRETNVFTEL